MLAIELTQHQLNTFSDIERVCSLLSILGAFFISTTYLSSKAFHNPINRLVFYASIGNMLTNVAMLIARSAVHDPNGPLCQIQAFILQWATPADSVWTLAMACNVYLTFYAHFNEEKLRRMEPIYIVCCYGIPFIPAFVYIWVKTSERGRMYGDAILWCWVSSEWDIWRVATFYGPVWAVIAVTFGIYGRVGWTIYCTRKELRHFKAPPPKPVPTLQRFNSVKTTEIFITSEIIADSDLMDLPRLDRSGAEYPRPPPKAAKGSAAYTVTVSSSQPVLQDHPGYPISEKSIIGHERKDSSAFSPALAGFAARAARRQHSSTYSIRHHDATEANKALKSYTKVAGLFFVALLITWIPSSANRVYSVLHPEHVNIYLVYGSSFVLPLQGFWNAIVYAMTSLPACKKLCYQMIEKVSLGRIKCRRATERPPRNSSRLTLGRGAHRLVGESESMTELAGRFTSSLMV